MTERGFLTGAEFKALRKLLGFSQEELRDFLGMRSKRSVNKWEMEESYSSVMADRELVDLFAKTEKVITEAFCQIQKSAAENPDAEFVLITYSADSQIRDFPDLPLCVHTAMIRRLFAKLRSAGISAGLVAFNPRDFADFCLARNLSDTAENRAAWAAVYHERLLSEPIANRNRSAPPEP